MTADMLSFSTISFSVFFSGDRHFMSHVTWELLNITCSFSTMQGSLARVMKEVEVQVTSAEGGLGRGGVVTYWMGRGSG